MEIGKSFSQGKLSWTVRYRSYEPAGDNNITGEIEIEISEPEEVEFPVKTGIRNADPYISFESENPVIELDSNTEKSIKFDVGERDNVENQESGSKQEGDDEQRCEIWFTDSGKEGDNYSCTFMPEEVISLCLQILSEDADDDEVMEQIGSEYDTRISAYTDLRRESRYCTDFADHVKILSFLYRHTDLARLDENIEKEMFRFVKNRVIKGDGGHQAYTSSSVSDVEQKIEICESNPSLPGIPDKDELIGLQQVNLAGELVDDGEFEEARERISKAVDRFEQSDSEELLPAKLKRDAIRGLRDESRCEFEEAAAHYSNAAEKAEETENIRAYEAWSEVAKIKEQLSEGNLEKARDIAGGIDYSLDSIHLIDLQKLTKLFEVYSDYAQGKRSDAAAVFADTEIKDKSKLPSSDAIVQFNTDYSIAFTMLITKQRRQQLGVDSEIDNDSHIIIRDAITPTGVGSAEIEQGETFTAAIDSISESGNGVIIENNGVQLDAHMNIGSVTRDSVGEQVTIKKVHPTFGWCLTDSVKDDNYKSEFEQMIPHKKTSHITSSPPTESDSGEMLCPRCDTILEDEVDLWSCLECDYEHIIDKSDIKPNESDRSENGERVRSNDGSQVERNSAEVSKSSNTRASNRDYTETKRAQRDSQFREEVKEAYNQTCAVCGADRMTPDGRPEVEAAHIRPVSEGGKDTITNGIALCRLHHWAFDNDWISIKDDYSIVVKDAPEVSGYEDFAQYQGSRLNIPKSEENQPDRNALQFHRRHHGFKNGR